MSFNKEFHVLPSSYHHNNAPGKCNLSPHSYHYYHCDAFLLKTVITICSQLLLTAGMGRRRFMGVEKVNSLLPLLIAIKTSQHTFNLIIGKFPLLLLLCQVNREPHKAALLEKGQTRLWCLDSTFVLQSNTSIFQRLI